MNKRKAKLRAELLSLLTRPTTKYVIINIMVSSVGFLRSFAFMRWLGLEELGLISLVQTVMQFVSFFQLGLINGGYRMFSLNKVKEQAKVNNVLFSAFSILLFVFIVAWSIIVAAGTRILMDNYLLFVAVLAGVLTLINNWLNNTLIGKQKLDEINIVNLISIIISILSLSLVYFIGFWGAVISVTILPLCNVLLILLRNEDLRPTKFLIDLRLVREILSYGFIPFISSIFVMLNLQIERWSIAGVLGNEALGCFYLVFLFNTLFMLLPISVQNIFFPRAVQSYDERNLLEFKNIIKRFSLVTVVYDVVILLLTAWLFKPLVSLIFPIHVNNVIYVYLFLPGLVAYSFDSVIGLVLNASLRLKILFISGLSGFITNMVGVFLLKSTRTMTLESMACLKSLVLVVPFCITLAYVLMNWRKIEKGYSNIKYGKTYSVVR